MKDSILIELSAKWMRDAKEPECADGSDEARISNAIEKGKRKAKMRCADDLMRLVELLGGADEPKRLFLDSDKARSSEAMMRHAKSCDIY